MCATVPSNGIFGICSEPGTGEERVKNWALMPRELYAGEDGQLASA